MWCGEFCGDFILSCARCESHHFRFSYEFVSALSPTHGVVEVMMGKNVHYIMDLAAIFVGYFLQSFSFIPLVISSLMSAFSCAAISVCGPLSQQQQQQWKRKKLWMQKSTAKITSSPSSLCMCTHCYDVRQIGIFFPFSYSRKKSANDYILSLSLGHLCVTCSYGTRNTTYGGVKLCNNSNTLSSSFGTRKIIRFLCSLLSFHLLSPSQLQIVWMSTSCSEWELRKCVQHCAGLLKCVRETDM